ncbi:MAG: RNA polymerase sigma factor [Labedaea sp.]
MTALGYDAVPCDDLTPDPADLPWQSVEELYHQVRNSLLVQLYYLLWNKQDAEDVLQDTFVQAARKWHTLRDRSRHSAGAWLRRTAVNLAYNRIRQRGRRHEVSLDDGLADYLTSSQIAPEDAYEVSTALAALRCLSGQQRESYLLKHYFGFEMTDIAAHLGCKASTARVHLNRAQETIKRKLDQFGEPSVARNGQAESGVES